MNKNTYLTTKIINQFNITIMKKNLLFSAMAAFMLLFTVSCTQDEIVSTNGQQSGTASLAVNIPVNNPVTRAVPNIPEGYKLRCILQLVDGSNAPIENQKYVQEVAAGSESTTFTFKTPSVAYKCLLWADYVKPTTDQDLADADNIYTTADLKAIGYTGNAGTEMFNSDAADAFYGASLEASSNKTQAITLARPFTRIALKSTAADYADYDKITVTNLPAPTGFNVLTGQTAGYAGKGDIAVISSTELTIEGGSWFSTYLFVGSNAGGNLGTGNDILFTLKKSSDNSTKELKFSGTDIPLTQNNTVTGDVTPGTDDNSKVEVTFPDEMIDPNKMQVGDYIYKDGTFGKTFVAAEESNPTIGIVFALKTNAITDASEYNKGGMTIAGYAMALTSTVRAYLGASENDTDALPIIAQTEPFADIYTSGTYEGYKYSEVFNTAFATNKTSVAFNAYKKWITGNAHSADNLSGWYIPSCRQVYDISTMLFGLYTKENTPATDTSMTNAVFIKSYNVVVEAGVEGAVLDNGTAKTGWLMSSSYTDTARPIASVVTNIVDGTREGVSATTFAWGNGSRVCIRPILTVFEAAE